MQEKIIASNSRKLVIVADFRKNSETLGQNWKEGIPIEVIPMAYVPIMEKLRKMDAKPLLRMARAKAGPLVTDNGNFIIDADFGIIEAPEDLEMKLLKIPGIVDTGLFISMADKAYVGLEDGEIIQLKK